MSEYVPTTGEVRARMVESIAGGTVSVPGGYGDLARDDAENIVDAILGELAAHDAEVAARALEEAAEAVVEQNNDFCDWWDDERGEYTYPSNWLRERALKLREA